MNTQATADIAQAVATFLANNPNLTAAVIAAQYTILVAPDVFTAYCNERSGNPGVQVGKPTNAPFAVTTATPASKIGAVPASTSAQCRVIPDVFLPAGQIQIKLTQLVPIAQ